MKAAILAGAVAALLYGKAARAGDCDTQVHTGATQADVSAPERSLDTGASAATDVTPDGAGGNAKLSANEAGAATSSLAAADTQSGVGGSGDVAVEPQTGTGGSGPATEPHPCPTPPATGAGGAAAAGAAAAGTGGSGAATDRPVTQQAPPPPPPPPSPAATDFTTTETDKQAYEPKHPANMRGLTVTLGGGVEGYTQALAPEVSPGPSVAVNANVRPTRVLGFELGYSGALNEIKHEDNVNGADIVRNGGQAAMTVGLTTTPVQPYVLGGIGLSHYNVRDDNSARFQDDNVGNVPVGAGLRTHLGDFTADARVGYNFLFDQEFARRVPTTDVGSSDVEFSDTGRYNATLNFGVTF